LMRFCLEKPLSHIAVHTGITITLLHKLLKLGQLIDHSRVVPANSQASKKDLFEIISLMVSTISNKRLIYTSYGMGIFIFKLVLGWVIFSLTFPCTGCLRNYRFWDGLQFFLPFNSRFLDEDGQKLCGKSTLFSIIRYWMSLS
jgi:hypothetical protein